MLKRLPGWVVDNATSLKREAAPYIDMTPDQRGELLAMACSIAVSQARGRADSARVFAYRDPLPASTEQALERLRALTRKILGHSPKGKVRMGAAREGLPVRPLRYAAR